MKSIKIRENNKIVEYSVNNFHRGLWLNGKQISGTCDFIANSPKELARKINKENSEIGINSRMVKNSAVGW